MKLTITISNPSPLSPSPSKELELGRFGYKMMGWDVSLRLKGLSFSIARISEKSRNVLSNIFNAESLSISRASNNPVSFPTAIKPLVTRLSRQQVSIERINSIIVYRSNKHQRDVNNACKSKQELLNLVSLIIYSLFIYLGRPVPSVAFFMEKCIYRK